MQIEQVVVGPFEVNCWVVWAAPRQAIVIDPGDDADLVEAMLHRHQLEVAAYVLTHGHIDHVSATAALCGAHPAPVAVHVLDAPWAFTPANQMPPYYPPPARPANLERKLREGQQWDDGGLTYTVMETPGHTPGSICLLFNEANVLFSGDTLFAGSIGRTDLPGGDQHSMTHSLQRLAGLAENITVYPGHGPLTSIGHEKRTNYFLRA